MCVIHSFCKEHGIIIICEALTLSRSLWMFFSFPVEVHPKGSDYIMPSSPQHAGFGGVVFLPCRNMHVGCDSQVFLCDVCLNYRSLLDTPSSTIRTICNTVLPLALLKTDHGVPSFLRSGRFENDIPPFAVGEPSRSSLVLYNRGDMSTTCFATTQCS